MISVLRSAFRQEVLGRNVVNVIAYGFTFNRLRKRRIHNKNHSVKWLGVKVLQRLFRQRSKAFKIRQPSCPTFACVVT